MLLALTAAALVAWPAGAGADDVALAEGATVRIRSASIPAGWHTGRIKRDDRRCSMVQLDRPTQHGRTLLALQVVDALQLGQTGAWTAIDARRAIAAEPPHCLAEHTN